MNTSTSQLIVSKTVAKRNSLLLGLLQDPVKAGRRLGRLWKRCLPTVEFGRSANRPDRAYRRAALLAARRGDRQASCRLEAAARAVGGGQ